MPIKKLDSIFRPKRIALIGVSNDPKSVGGITLTNLVGAGYQGVVYPINPNREAVMGIPCYPDIKSLPKTPDLAVIMTAAKAVPGIIKECGEAGINGIIIMSAGFKETGSDGKTLEENAFIKSNHIFNNFQCNCFSDDTGLEIESLNGRPGVYSARYAGEEGNAAKNIEKILQE